MKIQALSTAVHDLIGDGKTENALALLKQEIPSIYPKGMIDVTMLKSRYIQAHDDFAIRGVISNTDFDARVSQINLSILEFIERISHKEETVASKPEAVSTSVTKKVKHALKISTPGLVILFSKKSLISFISFIALGFGVKHFYFNSKSKTDEKKAETEIKSIPVQNDTTLLNAKLKAFEKDEVEEARIKEELRLGKRKNVQTRLKQLKEMQRNVSHPIKKPSTYSNEMDTIKPMYSPAPKKILIPTKPDNEKQKGA